ncbi:MAG: YihY/virulence factor BrkB family protein [Acidobacteriota bacterium]
MPTAPAPGRLTRLAFRLGRSVRLGGRAARLGVVEFYSSDNLTFASSIAYYSLLSMFPFLLLVLGVLGLVTVGDRDATLLQLVTRAVPGKLDFLFTQIHELSRLRLQVSVVGFVLALWGSMGIFGAITSAINHAWGVEKRPGFWKHKLIALTMLSVAAVLLVITLLLVSSVKVAEATWFASVINSVPGLNSLRGFALRNAPTPMFMVVIGLMYYYVPNAKVRLRDVWWGAVIAGLLWRLAFDGFSWYIGDLSRFTVLGQVAAVALFLVWIYLSAVIFLYGAEVSAAYSRLNASEPRDL